MATALLAISLVFGGGAHAQDAAPSPPAPSPEAAAAPDQPTFKPEELEQILAPVALYPDVLLAQVLMASTYPLEIVQADRWLERPEHKDLKGEALAQALEGEKWDPSVKSLAPFPQILNMMSDQLDWTQRLGDAVLAQRKDVMAAVQRLRKQAEAAGTLTSTEQQTVVVEQGQGQAQTVAIKPADPEKVYVPVYNPTVAYGPWPYPSYPPPYYPPPPAYAPFGSALVSGMGFAAGVAVVGSIWGWSDCDWRGNDINVNTNTYNTINRTNIEAGRATRLASSTGGTSWQFQPAHRGGVAYRDAASRRAYQRPIAGTAAARQQYRGYANTPARSGRPALGTAQGQQRPAIRGENRQPSLSRQAPLSRREPAAFSRMQSGPAVAAQSSRGQASRQASAARSAPSPGARAPSPAAPRAAPGRGGGGGGGRR